MHVAVQIETKNGELYRGELYEAEDNWNCQMRAVQMTGRVRLVLALCYAAVPHHVTVYNLHVL
jgi:small nuclear ribonucleoprotein (snRNP)-like protein